MNWFKKLFSCEIDCNQCSNKEETIDLVLLEKLRDRKLLVEYAGQALIGLISGKEVSLHDIDFYTTRSFEIADSMVKTSRRWLK